MEATTENAELLSLLAALVAAGFSLHSCDNGGGREAPTVANLTACDECHLFLRRGETRATIFLVFGNSPGELCCDYSAHPELERVISAESDKFSA